MTDTFDFPFHKLEEQFPDSGFSVKFGKSYSFNAAPDAPEQITYVLSMTGMRYYTNVDNTLNRTINPKTNILTLRDFYTTHLRYASFFYPHPVEGNKLVRFKDPLKIPTAIDGGKGILPEFQITLELQP